VACGASRLDCGHTSNLSVGSDDLDGILFPKKKEKIGKRKKKAVLLKTYPNMKHQIVVGISLYELLARSVIPKVNCSRQRR
jgi:hypothetical protein